MIQDREVITGVSPTGRARRGRLWTEQRAVGIPTHTNVQSKHARAIEIRGAVKVTIVFGHDRGEGKLVLRVEVVIRILDKERISGCDPLCRDDDINARERAADVLGDGA